MKRYFWLGASLALSLLAAAPAARTQEPTTTKGASAPGAQPAAPKQLTAEQKLELREYQLRSSNATAQMAQLEIRARDLQSSLMQNDQQMRLRIAEFLKAACGDADKCDLDLEGLQVKAKPVPAHADGR